MGRVPDVRHTAVGKGGSGELARGFVSAKLPVKYGGLMLNALTRLCFLPVCLLALTGAAQPEAQAPARSGEQLRDEAFVAAQYAMISSAAAAVDRMTARFTSGGGELGKLETQRDQLTGELGEADRRLSSINAAPASDGRDDALKQAVARRQQVRGQLDQLDQQIASRFPQYFELTRPNPLSIRQVQRLLNQDEALLLALVLDDATYVWAISHDRAAWNRVEALAAKPLMERVNALRASMGVAGARGSVPEDTRAAKRVTAQAGAAVRSDFQTSAAHELYQQLLAPLDPFLRDKKVLLTNVSGPLTSLPLGLLLTEAPAAGEPLSQAKWLSDRHAMAELPSVSSLRALRCLLIARKADAHRGCETAAESLNHRRGQRSAHDLVGFGAPILGGKLPDGSSAPPTPADIMSGAGAIPAKLRSLSELPQAKAELDSLAQQFGLRGAVFTGAEATEAAVKSSGSLQSAQFVVFSTHGLLATEIGENTEPGLVFTPPAGPVVGENDGLLTASEAAQLRLAADLVVLSACNTAAPSGKPGAEGLSGLARAFLFAGARSMLVSHWAVSDEATSRLMQETFRQIGTGGVRGRALALQKAMQTLRTSAGGRFADPRYWAPFTLVGEPVS